MQLCFVSSSNNMRLLLLIVVLSLVVKLGECCNGYALQTHYIRNCKGGKDVMKLKKITVDLDSDCNIIFKGCVEFTKDMNTAVNNYNVKKPPLINQSGVIDGCEQLKEMKKSGRATATSFLNGIGVTSCPVKKGTVCTKGTRKINIGKHKNKLAMAAGKTEVVSNVDHGNGKSCIEVSMTLAKK